MPNKSRSYEDELSMEEKIRVRESRPRFEVLVREGDENFNSKEFRQKFTKKEEIISNEAVIKKKTIKLGGRSTGVSVAYHSITLEQATLLQTPFDRNLLNSISLNRKNTVEKNFREFLDSSLVYKPKRGARMRKLAERLIEKYIGSENKQELKATRGLVRRLVSDFWELERNGKIRINQKREKNYCASFIEYALFLRSVYGAKFVPLEVNKFLSLTNHDGKLDYTKLGEELNAEKAYFGIPLSRGDKETVISKFSRFVDFTIGTNWRDSPDYDQIRQSANLALEEAVSKYNINDENLKTYLPIAILHSLHGAKKGYRVSRSNLAQQEISGGVR